MYVLIIVLITRNSIKQIQLLTAIKNTQNQMFIQVTSGSSYFKL